MKQLRLLYLNLSLFLYFTLIPSLLNGAKGEAATALIESIATDVRSYVLGPIKKFVLIILGIVAFIIVIIAITNIATKEASQGKEKSDIYKAELLTIAIVIIAYLLIMYSYDGIVNLFLPGT